jgi:hypothetical protein
MGMNDIPVVFIIFNRPQTTKRVFKAISEAKPKKLFVIADGPRLNKPGEIDTCMETRSIIEDIDWDCEVYKNFSDVNLGCAIRISTGLDWVFDQVEAAIILEDDCLPEQSFFPFCKELLNLYWDDERIFSISGSHLPWFKKRTNFSYFMSSNAHVWGWATWKRSWRKYDIKLSNYPELIKGNWMPDYLHLSGKKLKGYKKVIFDLYHNSKKPFTWDYQLVLCSQMDGSHNIVPSINMVSNIGFGVGECHSNAGLNICANNKTQEISFPLIHPTFFINDKEYDLKTINFLFRPTLKNKLIAFYKDPVGVITKKIKRMKSRL